MQITNAKSHSTKAAHASIFQSKKSQSAMEYLMTYGWAILIIAVVLVALFQTGVFNSANFAPKAQPGSCQVFKTTASTSLEGTCNNMLPQYVAQFNGWTSNVMVSNTPLITGNQITEVVWVEKLGPGNQEPWGTMIDQNGTYLSTCSTSPSVSTFGVGIRNGGGEYPTMVSADCPSVGQWAQYVGTYNGSSESGAVYINGVLMGTNLPAGDLRPGAVFLGQEALGSYNFNGLMANVQLYNTSLSLNDIKTLYREGIGGAPFDIRNLTGWWPLNGNANDYSGNLNNGVATNVIYTGSWTSGYSQP